MVTVQQIIDAIPKIKQIIQNHPDSGTRAAAIRVLSKIGFDELLIAAFLNYPDRTVQQAAASSLIGYGNTTSHDEAKSRLFEWLNSLDTSDRKTAIELISELPTDEFDDRLPVLLEDPEKEIQLAVIKAIGLRNNESILASLFDKFRGNEKQVGETLVQAGSLSLSYISDHIIDKKTTAKQKEYLIHICARIGGGESHRTLLELLHKLPLQSAFIIKALYRSHYKAGHIEHHLFEHITREYLYYAAEILHMQKRLDPNSEKYTLLFSSLQLELVETRDVLLCLFSFLYDREKMIKVKNALQMKKKEVQANAFELVDMTVKKDFANPFSLAFEQGDLEHRCNALRNIFPKDIFHQVENILTKILSEEKFAYNNWTMACSLYTSKKFVHRIEKNLVRKYISSDDFLLKETAEYAS